MIITLLFLCIIFILLCHYLIHHGRYWQLIDQIPGPPSHFLIGNSLLFIGSLECNAKKLEEMIKTYNPIVKVWFFNFAAVGITHPDDVEKILNNPKKHIEKGYVYNMLKPWLGTGMLTSNATKWRKQRKMLTPKFHFNILKKFVNIQIREGDCMTQRLKDNKELIVNDLLCFTSYHTLSVLCETILGISMKNNSDFQQYFKELNEIKEIAMTRIAHPWLYSDMIFAFTSLKKRQTKTLKFLHGFTEKIIKERKQYHENTSRKYLKQFDSRSSFSINDEGIIEEKKSLGMLDILIAESYKNKMSDLDIREEIDNFMFAGQDTSAIALCYTILLLAEHKNIQDRVRSEVNAIMLENNGKLTMAALNNMSYLERCLKESLRLYPSGPNISRMTSEDVKLNSYIVPAETMLLIPIKCIHRNPEFWPNPEVFDPDRFLPENIQNRHPFTYLPFSAGPRNCLGQRFAMLELKAMMAPLLHNFYFEPVDYLKDFRFQLDVVTHVTHPIRVKFIPIEQNAII